MMMMTMDKNCDDDEDDDVCWYKTLSSVSSHNNMVSMETCQSKGFDLEFLFRTANKV